MIDRHLEELYKETSYMVNETQDSLYYLKKYCEEKIADLENSPKYKELKAKEADYNISDDELETVYDELDEFDDQLREYEKICDWAETFIID